VAGQRHIAPLLFRGLLILVALIVMLRVFATEGCA
jgi:hypothetical protein